VSANEPQKHQPFVIANQNYQSVIVAFNIKDNTVIGREASVPVSLLYVFGWTPLGSTCKRIPSHQRSLCIWMFFPKFPKSWYGYDSHVLLWYQFGIIARTL